MIPRNLEWVHSLINCLNIATENFTTYNVDIKSRKALVTANVKKPFHLRDEKHIRIICKAFAERNGSRLREVSFKDGKLEILVLSRYENGPTSKKDPLMEDDSNDTRAGKEKEAMD